MGPIIRRENEIKVVQFSSLYIPINGLFAQKTLGLKGAFEG